MGVFGKKFKFAIASPSASSSLPHASWTPPATAFVVWFSRKLWAPQFRKQPDKQPALSVQGEKSCSFQVDLCLEARNMFPRQNTSPISLNEGSLVLGVDASNSCISKKESVDLKKVPFDSQRYTFWVRTAQPKEFLSWWPLWNHWLQNTVFSRLWFPAHKNGREKRERPRPPRKSRNRWKPFPSNMPSFELGWHRLQENEKKQGAQTLLGFWIFLERVSHGPEKPKGIASMWMSGLVSKLLTH